MRDQNNIFWRASETGGRASDDADLLHMHSIRLRHGSAPLSLGTAPEGVCIVGACTEAPSLRCFSENGSKTPPRPSTRVHPTCGCKPPPTPKEQLWVGCGSHCVFTKVACIFERAKQHTVTPPARRVADQGECSATLKPPHKLQPNSIKNGDTARRPRKTLLRQTLCLRERQGREGGHGDEGVVREAVKGGSERRESTNLAAAMTVPCNM